MPFSLKCGFSTKLPLVLIKRNLINLATQIINILQHFLIFSDVILDESEEDEAEPTAARRRRLAERAAEREYADDEEVACQLPSSNIKLCFYYFTSDLFFCIIDD